MFEGWSDLETCRAAERAVLERLSECRREEARLAYELVRAQCATAVAALIAASETDPELRDRLVNGKRLGVSVVDGEVRVSVS